MLYEAPETPREPAPLLGFSVQNRQLLIRGSRVRVPEEPPNKPPRINARGLRLSGETRRNCAELHRILANFIGRLYTRCTVGILRRIRRGVPLLNPLLNGLADGLMPRQPFCRRQGVQRLEDVEGDSDVHDHTRSRWLGWPWPPWRSSERHAPESPGCGGQNSTTIHSVRPRATPIVSALWLASR